MSAVVADNNDSNVCKSCLALRETSKDENMEKCVKWLENCSVSDGESEDGLSSTVESCSTFDDIAYGPDGVAVVDKIRVNNQYDLDEGQLHQLISSSQNVYQNVKIHKSKKIHLGNVTVINGPVYINQTQNVINQVSITNNISAPSSSKVSIVDRINWMAQPPIEEYKIMNGPAKYVIICHTATEDAFTQSENILLVRLTQQFHIESRKFADIAYNFLIGNDGNTYVGRGWGKVGAHTFRYDTKSIGICFIGTFKTKLPPPVSLGQAKLLIEYGIENGHIEPNYSLIGHCQAATLDSPGDALFREIKTWDHFNPTISTQSPPLDL